MSCVHSKAGMPVVRKQEEVPKNWKKQVQKAQHMKLLQPMPSAIHTY